MSKHGEGAPSNSGQEQIARDDKHKNDMTPADRYKDDKILQWIEKRRTQLANAEDHPSTEEGLRILDELQERREKAIRTLLSKQNEALKKQYDEALKNTINHAYGVFQDDVNYVREQAKTDPSLTASEVERRIAEREEIYRKQVRSMRELAQWEKYNRCGDDGVNKKGGEGRFREGTSQTRESLAIDRDSLTTISQFIPKMEWQTAAERTSLIEKVYKRFPKLPSESNEKYKERLGTLDMSGDIDEAIADILIDPNSFIGRELKRRLAELEKREKSIINEAQKGVAALGWSKKVAIRGIIAEQKRQEAEDMEKKKAQKNKQRNDPGIQEKGSMASERRKYKKRKATISRKLGILAQRLADKFFPDDDQE